MKQAVITGERQVELVEVPDPQPKEDWVLVKVHASALCTEYKAYWVGYDLSAYDVGTGLGQGELLDTPTLGEVWRTAPYLQDGRAATMIDVLTIHNPDDSHGITLDLTADEIPDLAEYVLSR